MRQKNRTISNCLIVDNYKVFGFYCFFSLDYTCERVNVEKENIEQTFIQAEHTHTHTRIQTQRKIKKK